MSKSYKADFFNDPRNQRFVTELKNRCNGICDYNNSNNNVFREGSYVNYGNKIQQVSSNDFYNGISSANSISGHSLDINK